MKKSYFFVNPSFFQFTKIRTAETESLSFFMYIYLHSPKLIFNLTLISSATLLALESLSSGILLPFPYIGQVAQSDLITGLTLV